MGWIGILFRMTLMIVMRQFGKNSYITKYNYETAKKFVYNYNKQFFK